ncbi:MAG: response regulator transcription factor [Firmicutes bacterium]|nr:response regulator transcription factor [Bacillota bacterium]
MAHKILIVDDDVNICQLLNLYLIKDGFSTAICHNGREALKILEKEKFDVILLDIMMPEMDGFETLTEIRKTSRIPVIFVSAKGESMDKISGLDIGADDYVTKPFEPQELISRIKACLRRSAEPIARRLKVKADASDITLGSLVVSLKEYTVTKNGIKLEMAPKEIEILHHLITNPKRVHSREQLFHHLWTRGPNEKKSDTRTIDVHVKRIREKIGESDKWKIETVWGVGYKFLIFD